METVVETEPPSLIDELLREQRERHAKKREKNEEIALEQGFASYRAYVQHKGQRARDERKDLEKRLEVEAASRGITVNQLKREKCGTKNYGRPVDITSVLDRDLLGLPPVARPFNVETLEDYHSRDLRGYIELSGFLHRVELDNICIEDNLESHRLNETMLQKRWEDLSNGPISIMPPWTENDAVMQKIIKVDWERKLAEIPDYSLDHAMIEQMYTPELTESVWSPISHGDDSEIEYPSPTVNVKKRRRSSREIGTSSSLRTVSGPLHTSRPTHDTSKMERSRSCPPPPRMSSTMEEIVESGVPEPNTEVSQSYGTAHSSPAHFQVDTPAADSFPAGSHDLGENTFEPLAMPGAFIISTPRALQLYQTGGQRTDNGEDIGAALKATMSSMAAYAAAPLGRLWSSFPNIWPNNIDIGSKPKARHVPGEWSDD